MWRVAVDDSDGFLMQRAELKDVRGDRHASRDGQQMSLPHVLPGLILQGDYVAADAPQHREGREDRRWRRLPDVAGAEHETISMANQVCRANYEGQGTT
ncbi:unnamed protein product [Strongylus vulgaris]|uniref:Uncharacterized protein n=1 Tax=Strongylus vulgaris TaxID=40348 RepID=A0A3P7LKB7_STRVU|nr:unnamed protein product [Strongylus vulgaris]